MTRALVMKRTDSLDSDFNADYRSELEMEFPSLEGRQAPQALVRCEGGDFTHGRKAIELARRFGITLMPWQREQVLWALAVDENGRWLHADVVLLCPRQNGKSLILEVIMLYRMFVLNHQIVFSAHQWRTAKSIRNRLWRRIKSRKWAERRIVRNTASAGEAEMETAEGGKLQFTTRSNDMGRGFDEIDLLLLDEAYNLESGELDAVAPTQLAAEDPQTFYTSSAVNRDKHPKGAELSRIRYRAVSGAAEGMLFSEFCAPPDVDRDDPRTWKLANPSYGFPKLVDAKKMRSMRSKLTDNGFDVEMLGWGRWYEFGSSGDEDLIVPREAMQALTTSEPVPVADCVLAVEVSPDADRVGLVAAGEAADGIHLQPRPASESVFSVDDTVKVVAEFVDRYRPAAVVLDKDATAGVLVPALQTVGIDPVLMNGSAVSLAYREFKQAVLDGSISLDSSELWMEQLEVARGRQEGGKYPAIDRYSGDVSELVAATFALWGLQRWLVESREGAGRPVEEKKMNPHGVLPMWSKRKQGGVLVA